MNIGIFNARGINETEHFIPLEIEEFRKRGHTVKHFWIKGDHPTQNDIDEMDFAIYHFIPTALHFMNQYVPFCILPTANDIFPNNGQFLKIIELHPMCKFVGYQSFYHKKKYDEWGLKNHLIHIPHCARINVFKREKSYNPDGYVTAGGRLISKKGLGRIISNVDNLVIFGSGPLLQVLHQVNPKVNFTGYLNGEEMKELYEDSSVYLFPALITPDGDSEGISNTIKEAMLMEVHVICTPIAGNVEFENVSFLTEWNRESIKNAIESLPRESNKKGRKEILNNFSPEVCINKLEKAIQEYVR